MLHFSGGGGRGCLSTHCGIWRHSVGCSSGPVEEEGVGWDGIGSGEPGVGLELGDVEEVDAL